MRFRPLVALLASLAFASAARGELTLQEAMRRAVEQSPSISALSLEEDAARAVAAENRASRLPSLALGANATRYSDPMVVTPIHGFTPGNLPQFDETLVQSALTASYTLFDAGAREARIAQAERLAGAAAATTEDARQTVALRAAVVYSQVTSRAAIVAAHDSRLRSLDAERRRVGQLEDVGRVPRVDVLRVDAAIAAAVAERADAAAGLNAAERELSRLTNLPLDQTRAANLARLPESSGTGARELLETRLDDTPQLRAARERVEAQRELVAAARSARWPRFDATANYLTFATNRDVASNEWNLGVQMRFSIFDAGATAARVARATAAAAAAERQLAAARLESGVALDRAIDELARSNAVVESLRVAVARFEEVVRVELLRLENGAGVQTDYLRAEADLVAARANLAAATYAASLAEMSIARITGTLDPDSAGTDGSEP